MNLENNDHLPLDQRSWTEKNGIPHWLVGFIWLVFAFIAFQVIASIFFLIIVVFSSGLSFGDLDEMVHVLNDNIRTLLWANSVGQYLGLALFTWIVAGISTSQSRRAFMRFRHDSNTLKVVGLMVLLMVALQPSVMILSWLNQLIPFPDGYMVFETQQMEMLSNMLTEDGIVFLALLHVGVTPSICEEILFRGYLQRLFEKSWGPWVAIVVTGVLFALFHIRLTQLLPLAAIGMLLSWVVWRSNSIYPGMAAHFANNGLSVLIVALYPGYIESQYDSIELPPVWLMLVSIGASAILINIIYQTTRKE